VYQEGREASDEHIRVHVDDDLRHLRDGNVAEIAFAFAAMHFHKA
jgi:hypothetical protein